MKKQLILAAISAALVAAPFVDAVAASGFSNKSSKSSSSSSSSKPSKPVSGGWGSSSTSSGKRDSGSAWGSSSTTTKRDSGSGWGSSSAASKRDSSSGWGSATTASPAPKRDYGASSWGSVTPSRKADTARPAASDYAPTNRVTPQPKPASGFNSAPTTAAVPAPSQPTAGFSDTKSSTKKKVAAVAGATALGGALYAAGANQEAVAAYQSSQEPASAATTAAPASTSATERTASTTTLKNDTRTTSTASVPSSAYPTQAQPQPQVIVVREAPRHRDYDDDAYWYQRGRDSAAREARIDAPSSTYSGTAVQQTQSATRGQVVQPSAPAPKNETSIGSVILWTFVILMVLGALGYFLMQVMNTDPSRKAKPAARKSNYTL